MDKKGNYIQLVKQAQSGDEESMNRLAELVRDPLFMYIHRLTLDDDLTQDILQESLLEMFKFLDKLEKANRFWSWLLRIATNNVNDHYNREKRRKTTSMSNISEVESKEKPGGLENLIGQELRQVVSSAMLALKPKYRTVLTLRCYEEMAYSEISEVMGCTQFGARMQFVRAKKALVKQLSRRGLGKGTLLLALALFGKMTATSEAAAASVSVTAATTKVSVIAGLIGMMSSKAAVVSLTTTGVLVAGAVVATSRPDKTIATPRRDPAGTSLTTEQAVLAADSVQECWYYYPPNGNGAVMMWLESDSDSRQSYSQWLQNEQSNYYRRKNTIYINNYRMWNKDLSVRRLPTDNPQLTEFLSQVEGKRAEMGYVPQRAGGLVVVVKQDRDGSHSQIIYRRDISDEEYFRYRRSAGARVVDKRDPMHKRGWTYFTITGQINGKEAKGKGRVPFIYAASEKHWPWVELKVGETIVNEVSFAGLGRPWMGLHTIDTVRRDAAEKQIWFETKYNKRSGKADVVLRPLDKQIVYTIDMEKDVIESITFSGNAGGQLSFDYLQDVGEAGNEFAEQGMHADIRESSEGILWLVRLAEGTLWK